MSAVASKRLHLALLVSAIVVWVWSGIGPAGRFNWVMETFPAVVGGAILVATYRRFQFANTVYIATWIFAVVLMVGGHWTYAQVPLGNWARDTFGLSRNHFDRVGHFLQGFVPALYARELLVRTSPLRPGKWLVFLSISVALTISAAYELFEWQYAVIFGGKQADDFLGSQGDIWDAQKDMLMALIGGVVANLGFARPSAAPPVQNRGASVKLSAVDGPDEPTN